MALPHSSDDIFIRKLTNIVLANLGNEKFGPKELANISGLSLYRLNRRLFSINRKKTSRFIREIRLEEALNILRNEEYTVSEVAYRSGFSNPSYFISCFREYFGYPPGKIRRDGGDLLDEEVLVQNDQAAEPKTNIRIIILASAAFFMLSVLGYFVYIGLPNNESPEVVPRFIDGGKSVAVLPFRNDSNDKSDQYIRWYHCFTALFTIL
jgi:AraC-like DNA-binding protein